MADLAVDNLKVSLGGNDILKGVSLTLKRGEIAALLGPSGSGKTTLLRAVAGLEEPSAGKITVAGVAMYDSATAINRPIEQRGLGFVFQSYALWPHRTVFDNVAYGLVLRGISADERKAMVQKALDSLGLGKLGHRYPHELSGGQQQRVAIARSLVYGPSVVLLDEPLSNLDAKLREEARAFLKELIERENLAALMVTHDQSEALAIANKILLLNGGVVEQSGTPEEMYAAPKSLFVAEFMGSNNRVDGRIEQVGQGRATLVAGAVRLDGLTAGQGVQSGRDGSAVIRLEAMRLADGPGPNRLALDLATSMFLGQTWEHVFRGEGIQVRVHHAAPLKQGRHHVEFPSDKLWIY